ncbi:retinol dehydrogenase 14-like [Styela clava]
MAEASSVKNGSVLKDIRMDGKTVLITGANTGIGYETAKDLSSRGAKVIMAGRDAGKVEKAMKEIKSCDPKANLVGVELDLASMESIRKCADKIMETEAKLDVLINNAGIMSCPQWKTKDGFEMQLGVNHIGHFLFTNLLLDLIKRSSPSRIVILSSSGHTRGRMNWDDIMSEKKYNPFVVYCQSKLANILFARELSRKLEGTGVTCNSVHPGLVKTELGRHFMNKEGTWNTIKYYLVFPFVKMIFKTPEQGAQTSIYCAVAPELNQVSGKYFADCKIEEEAPAAKNDEDAKRLWELSLEWTGLTK